MNSYALIILADVLLAVILACQKKYQGKAGTSAKASLIYTILSGTFSAAIFFVINGCTIHITTYSAVMATLLSIAVSISVFGGFAIMQKGNMSLYSLFLMSGGMVVPYVYGVLFLKEELNIARVLGLILIVTAIILANFTKDKVDKKQLAVCVLVFLVNGAASVISKVHQISEASKWVSSSDFVFLVAVSKIVISLIVLPFMKIKTDQALISSVKPLIWIVIIAAAADGTSYMLQLMGAVNLPATVLYPLVTGGTIVLSALTDFTVYREKLSLKQWLSVIIAFVGTCMFV